MCIYPSFFVGVAECCGERCESSMLTVCDSYICCRPTLAKPVLMVAVMLGLMTVSSSRLYVFWFRIWLHGPKGKDIKLSKSGYKWSQTVTHDFPCHCWPTTCSWFTIVGHVKLADYPECDLVHIYATPSEVSSVSRAVSLILSQSQISLEIAHCLSSLT